MLVNRSSGNGLSNIRIAFFDFDGVFTDNAVYLNYKGEETVRCSRSDGLGIERLKKAGIIPIVVSAERNPVVKARCKKLNIMCVYGIKDKLAEVKKIVRGKRLTPGEICFVGNDINDIACMRFAKYSFAVQDAYPEVIENAKWVTSKKGGHGAVREVCDILCEYRKKA